MRKSYAILLICAALLTACSSVKATNSEVEASPAYKPTLKVTWKASGHSITVFVDTDLHISPEHYAQARRAGEGHIHMYLDGGPKNGVKEHKHTFENLSVGHHTMKVSLHNNDHTPYDVTDSFEFDIK